MDYQKRNFFLFLFGHHTWVDFHRPPSLASRAWVILYNSSAAGSNLHVHDQHTNLLSHDGH
jgi:hypothetical protein